MHLAGYIVAYAILLSCAVVCAMKGKFAFAALGIFLPIFGIIGAVRPTKPRYQALARFASSSKPSIEPKYHSDAVDGADTKSRLMMSGPDCDPLSGNSCSALRRVAIRLHTTGPQT
jgi:hypothetical protein